MRSRQKAGLAGLVLVLSGAAGGVDAIGWLALGHVFSAHMSGNTVGVTTHVALGDWAVAGRHALAIAAFVGGLVLGAVAATVAYRRESRASFALALACEAALLLALLAWGGLATPRGAPVAGGSELAMIALAAGAMGVQSATLRRVEETRVRTTYVTGVLTRMVEHAVLAIARAWDVRRGRRDAPDARGASRKALLLAAVWLAYATGGVASGLLELAVGLRAVALPLAAVVVAVVVDVWLARAGVRGAGPEEG